MTNLILIDFSWLYNRYFFVAKNKGDTSPSTLGLMLYQFLSTVHKNYLNSRIFIALDVPTSTLKNSSKYSGYKQNRDKEAKKEVYLNIKEIIKYLIEKLDNSFTFVKSDEYEADQVIASLCGRYHETNNIIIFSGDKDLMQLTYYNNVEISDKFEKGSFIIKTNEEIFSKFKNSKGEPFTRISNNKRDILKYRTLKGDISDNLSPVFPRIKDKEIAKIIKDYWICEETLSLPRISDIIDDIRGDDEALADKLELSKEAWLRNYEIMSLFNLEDIKIQKVI